ncbi:thioredoxin reductase [Candidatus Woesearchaeota archaeon]|jgi:thioredoxin reductase (NADPH)|nr:thioredoxin reductase [Candidatus Woesearchaeota archaeon]MDP7244714.1 FAD-dependent oxidoreductase [Flavobacteriales bacterium]
MKMYDTLIIGVGVTGLSTAMYAGRLNLKTIVFGTTSGSELPIGGVITLTDTVENYPGFKHITGQELAEKLEEHAKDYNIEIKEEKATAIKKNKGRDCFDVKTEKAEYHSKTIIFATGAKWRELTMKGAEEFKSKGVHYCALCDGALYKDKVVGIVGGSDSAAKEAILLAQNAKKVYIIYRGEKIRAEPINLKLIEKNEKIEVITNTNITEILGDKMVNKVILDKEFNGSKELELNGVFGAIGHIPLSDLAVKLGVKINKKKEIMVDRESKTNVKGVFAAGDVIDSSFKQAITGVAEGVVAAHSAYTYINENEFVCVFDDHEYKK